MVRYSKKEASGQVMEAVVAWVNDIRDAPNVNYAFELKVSTKAPEMTRTRYEGNVRKIVKDENGKSVKYFPPCADVSDLGLLAIMGSVGFADGEKYILLDVYEDRDGKIYAEGGDINKFPGVREAFDRAKVAFLRENQHR